MGENEIIVETAFFYIAVAQTPNPSARIDDDNIIAFRPDLDARGIATIL